MLLEGELYQNQEQGCKDMKLKQEKGWGFRAECAVLPVETIDESCVWVSLSEVPNCQSSYMRGGYFSSSHEGKEHVHLSSFP